MPTARAKSTPGRLAFLVALALVVMALMGTGCSMVVGFDTKVNEDGSGTVGVRVAADKELQSALGQQAGMGVSALFSALQSQLGSGWTTRTGTDPDGTQWTVAERSFKDPAEMQTIIAGTGGSVNPFSDVKLTQSENLFSVHTFFSGTMDTGKVTSSGDLQSQLAQIPANILSSVVKVENRLTLPGTIKSNNATEVQGSTLIWRGDGTSPSVNMTAESVTYKWGAVAAVIVVGALLIIAIALVLAVVFRRRGRQAATAGDATATEAAVVAPDTAPLPATAAEPEPTAPVASVSAAEVVVPPAEQSSVEESAPAVGAEPGVNAFPAPMPVAPEPAAEPAPPAAEPAPAAAPASPAAEPEVNAFLAPMPVQPPTEAQATSEVDGVTGAAEGATPSSPDDPSA